MQKVFLKWKIDIITADHGGYCSDAENEETFSTGELWCSYPVNADDYDMLKKMYHDFPGFYQMFNDYDAISETLPYIPNDDEGIKGGGSNYCMPSEHGLIHERKRIAIDVIDFSLVDRPTEIVAANPTKFKRYLRNIRETNTAISETLRPFGFPPDIIKVLCRYVWTPFD